MKDTNRKVLLEMSCINSSQTLKSIAVCIICLVSAYPLMAADRLNIIFVLCDDLGPGDIGILWQNGREGTQKFATPNFDQFAREGMARSSAHCPAPSCMATRSSLMTGRQLSHSC